MSLTHWLASFGPVKGVWMYVVFIFKIYVEVICCGSFETVVVGALKMKFVLRKNNKDKATIR